MPLIAFEREVPFVEITEAVHARIIDAQLIERAATTLALGRLLTRQAESLERQAHRTLISAIIEQTPADPAGAAEAEARARAMGVPADGAAACRRRGADAGHKSPSSLAVLEVAEAVAAGLPECLRPRAGRRARRPAGGGAAVAAVGR